MFFEDIKAEKTKYFYDFLNEYGFRHAEDKVKLREFYQDYILELEENFDNAEEAERFFDSIPIETTSSVEIKSVSPVEIHSSHHVSE